jgi:2-deoxy-D-gluconate 3-dehydrogenase
VESSLHAGLAERPSPVRAPRRNNQEIALPAPSSPFSLEGRVAVVTGGNRGIGRSIALGLARAGAAVAILARDEARNAAVLAELRALGVPAMAVRLDVTDRAALAPALDAAERELGGLDVLVNNAGVANPSGGVLAETEAVWDATLATHLHATFLLSKHAAASMVRRRRGKIVNLASMYSYFGAAAIPSYSAAKGAIVQLTKSMAIELAPHGIQVNAIAPGWIATEMTAAVREVPDWADFNRTILARTPAARWGEGDDVAGAAVFLASDAAAFVTGVTLPVDGGYSIC